MGLAIGILLFALGIAACWAWSAAVLIFLKGLVAFSLLFWGFIAFLLGFSERKAKAEFEAALKDAPSPVETGE